MAIGFFAPESSLGGETTDGGAGLTAGHRWPRGAKVVPALPHLRFGCELRLRRHRDAQLARVTVEIKAGTERGDQELRELTQGVAQRPLVARQGRVTSRNRLEVLGQPA